MGLSEGMCGGDDQSVVYVPDEEVLPGSSWKVCSQLISCSVMGMFARMGEIWLPMPVPCICLEDAELEAEVDDVRDMIQVEYSMCGDPFVGAEGSCVHGVQGPESACGVDGYDVLLVLLTPLVK